MRHIWRDVHHAVRVLLGRPVLTFTTVATLAIGIGGTSAMFSFANGLLLRSLPVPAADRVVRVFGASDLETLGITSYPNLQDVAERARSFAAMTIHQQTFVAYGLGDDTSNVAVELVSGGYFPTFGIAPQLGRALTTDDDRAGASRVAVVSDRWWRSRLGADPRVLGRDIHLNGTPFTIVGIAPPAFHGSYDAFTSDAWVPLMTYDVVRPRGLDIRRRTWGWLQATARLAPGASLASARAEVETIGAALRAAYPRENQTLAFAVVPASTLPESMTPGLARALVFAIIIAALVLLAACANVANASLATVSDRGAEIAVRMALGATRSDVARQWLVESVVVTAAATALGLLLTLWLRDAALALRPLTGADNFAPSLDIGWRVWAGAAMLMAVATALSGVLPAIRAARVDPAQPLRDGATASVGGRRLWTRSLLMSAQAAVALALVALAGLLGRSVATARAFDVGFDTAGLVLATANVSALGHDAAQSYAYHADVMARVRALPGVTAVTAAAVVPLGDNDERRGVVIDGYTSPTGTSVLSLATNVVWPGYFEMMRIPLVAGRAFAADDGRPDAPLVAVVNETMARRYWPSGDPVGRIIRLGASTVEVVGVAKDISYYRLGEASMPYLYLAYGPGQPYQDGLTFHVRTAMAPAAMARQLTRELRAPDARVRVAGAMAYADLRAAALFPATAMGWLSAGFAGLALALLVVGTYGVTAYAVTARRRELALRVALGAAPKSLRAGVVRGALAWGAPGALVGVALALAVARLLGGVLVGVTSVDPMSLAAGVAAVMLTASLAAYVPARRVGRTDLAAELRA